MMSARLVRRRNSHVRARAFIRRKLGPDRHRSPNIRASDACTLSPRLVAPMAGGVDDVAALSGVCSGVRSSDLPSEVVKFSVTSWRSPWKIPGAHPRRASTSCVRPRAVNLLWIHGMQRRQLGTFPPRERRHQDRHGIVKRRSGIQCQRDFVPRCEAAPDVLVLRRFRGSKMRAISSTDAM